MAPFLIVASPASASPLDGRWVEAPELALLAAVERRDDVVASLDFRDPDGAVDRDIDVMFGEPTPRVEIDPEIDW